MKHQLFLLVYQKCHGMCWYCGSPLAPDWDWQIDHQFPRKRGGADDINNLVLACSQCNQRKGNRTVEEYRHSLKLKIQSAISDARSALDRAGWVYRADPDEPNYTRLTSSEWADKIDSLLHEAAEKVDEAPFTFYGEIDYDFSAKDSTQVITETETVA